LADKLIAHELPHTLGLITFGHSISFMNFTRDFESFNDVLGNAEANENSTKLYDAIKKAAEEIILFRKVYSHLLAVDEPPKFRIFCLTDGEDNSSTEAYWKVAKFLQDHSILMDSIPLATQNSKLQGISVASGGLCLQVTEQQQGVALFEREAVLHVGKREISQIPLPIIVDAMSVDKLAGKVSAVEDVKSVAPKGMTGKVLKTDDIHKLTQQYGVSTTTTTTTTTTATTATTLTTASTTPIATTGTADYTGTPNVKRIFSEYRNIKANPVPGMECYISADNVRLWKITFEGPESTAYFGGRWMLSLEFPETYPFKAPELRFCTPIYHLNVNKDGKLCMDILSAGFSPAITVTRILTDLKNLVINPDPAFALDTVRANVYSDDKQLYFAQAKDHTTANASLSMDELKKNFQISD